jgi:hypothetical protein
MKKRCARVSPGDGIVLAIGGAKLPAQRTDVKPDSPPPPIRPTVAFGLWL